VSADDRSPQNTCAALRALFDDQPVPVRDAARKVVPALLAAAERLARRWLRQNAPKNLTLASAEPNVIRFAPTVGDGIELALHFPILSVSRTYAATPAGALAVVYQTHGKWDAPAPAIGVVGRNLVRRARSRVPVRPEFAAMLVSEKAAA
jgi:hypothetical protein